MVNGMFSIHATSCSLVIKFISIKIWRLKQALLDKQDAFVEVKNSAKVTLPCFSRTDVFLYDEMVSENDVFEAR